MVIQCGIAHRLIYLIVRILRHDARIKKEEIWQPCQEKRCHANEITTNRMFAKPSLIRK